MSYIILLRCVVCPVGLKLWGISRCPAANPKRRDFYVYRLEVERVPFYVGIGRDRRADDRVRYVKSLIKREKRGIKVARHMSIAVARHFIRRVRVRYVVKGFSRSKGLVAEKNEIERLFRSGALLANQRLNPARTKDPDKVIRDVQARIRRRRAAIGGKSG